MDRPVCSGELVRLEKEKNMTMAAIKVSSAKPAAQ